MTICRKFLHIFRHIREHLIQKDFPKDGRYADDVRAIENGDDTKGITFVFFRENSLELVVKNHNKVSLTRVSFCSNTESIRDDPYWTSRKNSLQLIELSSINKVN